MNTLRSTHHALYELENHHHSIIKAKDDKMAILQQRFSDLNRLHRKTKARIDEKIDDQDRLHTELKTLKKELAAEKANKGVSVEDVGKQIAEVKQKNAMLSAKVLGLEKELADERARGTANSDAKRELEVMKTKLADMVSGAKVKVEMIE
jgi:chromosome segregation ATPase